MDELIGLFGVSEEDGYEHSYEAQLFTGDSAQHHVHPEVEEGNVEFKLKLVNPTETRMEHLVTQMKWRLREGHGEAIYQIGVEDQGTILGLCEQELHVSLSNLNKMAHRLQADTTILREVVVDAETNRKAVEVLVRKLPSDKPFIDMRVCVLGSLDAGKSTLVGVLTNKELDNGRGRARLNLFRHLHEMQTGHTSSVCHDILGFDSHGNIIDYSVVHSKQEICEASSKLITLIDLPGGQKSLKTTIFGLTGYSPDVACITIAANQGIVDTTREHFGLALALNISCVVIITKCDLLSAANLARLESQVKSLLEMPGIDRITLRVRDQTDVVQAAKKFNTESVTPVFVSSCVTGEGIDLLKSFLNLVPRKNIEQDAAKDGSFQDAEGAFGGSPVPLNERGVEYKIDETYWVPNVGCVVGGVLNSGILRRGDELSLGPYEDGTFRKIRVTSLHRSGRAPCSLVNPNEAAAIAFKPNLPVRKGMVILGADADETAEDSADENAAAVERKFDSCLEFEAEMLVLYHPTRISTGFQCTLHIHNIVQTAAVISICPHTEEIMTGKASVGALATNDKAKVMFKFMKHCEYVRPGMRVLFRQGKSKGIGHVTRVVPYQDTTASAHK